MTTTPASAELLNRIATIRQLRPEFRFGQLVAIIGQLAEDETGHNLWDVEDEEFFFTDTATTEIYSLSLHVAPPTSERPEKP